MNTNSTQQTGTLDRWRHVDDQASVPIEGDVTVPLDVWRAHRDALSWRDGRTGVRLGPADAVDAIAGDLTRLALVVLESGDARADARREAALRGSAFAGEIRTAEGPRTVSRVRAPRRARRAPGRVLVARGGARAADARLGER